MQFCLPKCTTDVIPILFCDFISVLGLLKAGLLLLCWENLKDNFQFQIFLAQSPEPLLLWGETVSAEEKENRNWVKEETFTNSYCWLPFKVILIVVACFISSPPTLFILMFGHSSRIMHKLLQEQKQRLNYIFMYFILPICCPQQMQARKTMLARSQLLCITFHLWSLYLTCFPCWKMLVLQIFSFPTLSPGLFLIHLFEDEETWLLNFADIPIFSISQMLKCHF